MAKTPDRCAPTLPPTPPRPRITGLWVWTVRFLLVLSPLLALVALEGVLRIGGVGYETTYYIRGGFRDRWLSNPRYSWPFFGPGLRRFTVPAVMRSPKARGTFRIFLFGESAAMGTPDPGVGFGRILEVMLNERFPGTRFELMNTAMTSINSHLIRRIAQECASLEGDLFLVYMGNNEVLGPFGPATIFVPYQHSRSVIRASACLRSTRTGQLIVDVLRWVTGQRDESPNWTGKEMFFRQNSVAPDDPRLEGVYANFRENLQDICVSGHQAGAKVVVSTVLTNLRDNRPFYSVHRAGLSRDERTTWDDRFGEGVRQQGIGKPKEAVDRYSKALQIDDRFADLHFRLGQCLFDLGQFKRARRHFVLARDLDALRFRADSRINQIIRDVAGHRETDSIYLFDAVRRLSESRAPAKSIPGWDMFYDHVHLTFEGNYALASALFNDVVRLLPDTIRRSADVGVQPPTLERCAELLVYTPFDRAAAKAKMAQMTGRLPFPQEQGMSDRAEAERLQRLVTPESLALAARRYQESIVAHPDDLMLRTNYARLLIATHDDQGAAEQLQALLTRYPCGNVCLEDMAAVHRRLGRLTEAIEEFRQAIEWDPGARAQLGSTLLEAGQVDRAVVELRQAALDSPDKADVRAQLGKALLMSGRLEEARACFEAAIRIDPNFAEAHFGLGACLAQQNSPDLARPQLEKAVELVPDSAVYHLVLAEVCYSLRDTDAARIHYSQALALGAKVAGKFPRLDELVRK